MLNTATGKKVSLVFSLRKFSTFGCTMPPPGIQVAFVFRDKTINAAAVVIQKDQFDSHLPEIVERVSRFIRCRIFLFIFAYKFV